MIKKSEIRVVCMFFILFLIEECIANNVVLDSLLQQNKHLAGKDKVDNLIKISREYFVLGDTTGRKYSREAIGISKRLNYKEGEGTGFLFLGLSFDTYNKDTALVYYGFSADILSKINHPWAAYCYENSSSIYRDMGFYPEAVENALKALEIYKKSGDSLQTGKVLSSIGFIEYEIGNYETCIQWQAKAIKILKTIKSEENLGLAYGRTGISYDELGVYDSAHFYNGIAVNLFSKLNDDFYLSIWLSNIGNTFIKQKKYLKAEQYLHKARQHLTDKDQEPIIMVNLGKVYIETGRYIEASLILDSAIVYSSKLKRPRFLSEAYFRKYELNKRKGDISQALSYYIKYSEVEDSILNLEKTKQIAIMNARYLNSQKEKELLKEKTNNEKLQKDKAIAELKVFNRTKWLFILGMGSIILILLFAVKWQKNKRKTQSEKIDAIIKERKNGLKAVFLAQETERRRIAKDLHDGVGQQINAIKMFFLDLGEKISKTVPETTPDIDRIKSLLEDTGNEIRNISHEMMPKSLTELGLVDALYDLISNCFDKTKIKYTFEHFGIEQRLPDSIEIALYRISQELFQNILKHSKATKVDIQLSKVRNNCILIVEDNGQGFSFNGKKNGIGITNIISRLNTINGELEYETGIDNGTIATVRILLY